MGRTRSQRDVFLLMGKWIRLYRTKSDTAFGMVEDVLERSRFDFQHETIDGVDVYVAGEINAEDVLNSVPSTQGWVRLMFKHGPIVGIDLQALNATKKQSAFVHHLALSMLPPLLTAIVDIDAMWVPNGWNPEDKLPEKAHEGLENLMAGWHGLTVPEGNLSRMSAFSSRFTRFWAVDWFGMVSGGFHRGNSPIA